MFWAEVSGAATGVSGDAYNDKNDQDGDKSDHVGCLPHVQRVVDEGRKKVEDSSN